MPAPVSEHFEPAWRQRLARRPIRHRTWRVGLALGGLLTTAVLLVWISSWLHPPRVTGLVLVGADYADNLALPHNTYGWQVLEQLTELTGDSQLECWGQRLFRVIHPPLQLHGDVRWDQGLGGDLPGTIIIYVAAHGGVDQEGPYLLYGDARPADSAGRLRFSAVLESLSHLPEQQHKILVLDSTQLVADWSFGILQNDFARAVAAWDTRIAEIPNLVVILPSGLDERSWTSSQWRQTVFGHYLLTSLRGAATDLDKDGRLNAWDIFMSTREATQRWTQANRAARQTPILLPGGTAGRERAQRMDLLPVEYKRVESAAVAERRFELPEEITRVWKVHERLRTRNPSPAACAPVAWRCFRDLLVRYEELIMAGNRAGAARILPRWEECRTEIERNQQCHLASLQNSLAIYEAYGDRADSAAQNSADADGQRALESLWNAKPDERSQRWTVLCRAAGNTPESCERLRMALHGAILARVAEDPAANLQLGAQLVQLLDDPLHPRPVETHFLVMLARDLPAGAWSDRRRDLVRLALTTRCQAERNAWCLQNGGYAHGEQIAPRLRPLLTEADQQRRQGEDLVLGGEHDEESAAQHLECAAKLYDRAGKHAAVLATAIDVCTGATADLPYYARWIARQRGDLRDRRQRHQDWLARFERVCQSVHQLATALDQTPETREFSEAALSHVAHQTAALRTELKDFEEAIQESWQLLVSTDSPQAWCDLRNALRVPQQDVQLHEKLLASMFQTEQRLAAQSAEQLVQPVHVTTGQQTATVQWAAQAEGRVALAMLGRTRYAMLMAQDDPSFDEVRHRLNVFAVEARWWESVAVAGQAIGRAWNSIPGTIDRLTQTVKNGADQDAFVSLAQAAELSRILPAACELTGLSEPAAAANRVRMQHLLLWQATRSFEDHWYSEDPVGEPYYRTVVQAFLDDATTLADVMPVDQQAWQPLNVTTGLAFVAAQPLDLSSQPHVQVPIVLQGPASNRVPSGSPVLWVDTGPSLVVTDSQPGRHACQWETSSGMRPWLVAIGSPALRDAEQHPPTRPTTRETAFTVHGRYRGQVLTTRMPVRLHLTPDVAWSTYAPPASASVAVRAGTDLHEEYGDGKGSVAIVLDCTGSMGPPAGQPFSPDTKYAEATRTLGQVLTHLPAGTTLCLWVFGQAVGPEKTVSDPECTIRRVIAPMRWDPAQPNQLSDLLRRIEYPALEPWNGSPIVRAVLAVKEELREARGFKTIVVLTDGIDNRIAHDTQANPSGKDVTTLLRESFQDADIELNIIGFRMAAAEVPQAWEQLQVVTSLFPPGTFCTASESESLAAALDTALRQRLKYRLDPLGDKLHTPNLTDGQEVSRWGTNDQWYPHGLAPGNYRVEFNARAVPTRDISLNCGDRLLLQLDAPSGEGPELRAVDVGKTDYAWRPGAANDAWRATVLQNSRDADGGLQMLLGLERSGPAPNRTLTVSRPQEVWLAIGSAGVSEPSCLTRWHPTWGFPLATWQLAVPDWFAAVEDARQQNRVQLWWSDSSPVTADVVLTRPTDFHKIHDLAGKALHVRGALVTLASVSIETHPVQVGAADRAFQSCLAVRLRGPAGHLVWARPAGLGIAGQEHRYYRDGGHYLGLFWPVTADGVDTTLSRLEFISLQSFQESAARQGNTLELNHFPPPDSHDPGAQPID